MKRVKVFLAMLSLALCVLPVTGTIAAEGEEAVPSFVFCETFNDSFVPTNAGDSFAASTVSWVASAGKPFGVLALTLSVYKMDGNEEKLVNRRNVDVNSEWDTFGIRNYPVSEGKLKFALTTVEGKTICTGIVNVSKPGKVEEPKEEESLGARLEALFNRYSPKK